MTGLWPAGWEGRRGEPKPGAGPLILTVALPPALQRAADTVRPHEAALHAPAHLTLFRHLPLVQNAALIRDIRTLAAEIEAPSCLLLAPIMRERMWMAPARCPVLDDLRERLAERWHGLLSPGDIASPRLHISLSTGPDRPLPLPPGPWRLPGLLLWQYGEACWTPLVALAFHR